MTSKALYHALGLHMHQPPGNLRLLIETNPWEAEEIIRCYERAARYAIKLGSVARLHIGFSGVLLQQLMDPAIVDAYRHIVDIPEMLSLYREAENVDFSQWAGSENQRKAGAAVHDLSHRRWELRRRADAMTEDGRRALGRARELTLEAQTSCFLFWGDAWIPQLYARTAPAARELETAAQELKAAARADPDSPEGSVTLQGS